MDFKVENFIPARNLDVLKKAGLHKVAGAMLDLDELTLKEAVAQLGAHAYQKRAEALAVHEGLESYAALRGEKLASPVSAWGPHLSKSLPTALLGGGIGYLLSGQDPEDEKRKTMQGAALGGLGGVLHSLHGTL